MVPQGALTWHVDRRILNEKLLGQVHPVVSRARLAWRTNQRQGAEAMCRPRAVVMSIQNVPVLLRIWRRRANGEV